MHEYLTRVLPLLAGVLCSAWPGSALALSFEYGDWQFSVDTTLGAAAQWRTESRDKRATDDPFDLYLNFDDGNNNFDPGLVSARGSFILELAAVYGDLSFFLRSDGLYDTVYENSKSDMSALNYFSYNGALVNGGQVERGDYPDGTRDEHGKRLRLLEAFANYQFELGERLGSIRLGSQVIAWGEATIYQGVNTLQNPIDGGAALSPGVEAKEIFLPTSALDLKIDLTSSLGAEVYYKLDWVRTTQPGVGSFLSNSDFTGPGAQRILLGPAGTGEVRGADKPGNSGQWGAALRYLTEGGTNFTLSYNNNHANAPGSRIVFDPVGGSYSREVYLEDIEFWQFSVATNLGEALVYADIAYSDNAPFVDQSPYLNQRGQLVAADLSRGNYRQLVLGMTDVYTAFPWLSRQIALTAEVLYQSNNLGEGDKRGTPYIVTDDAWGYQALAVLRYFSVLPGMDVDVTLSFRQDVDGFGATVMKNNLIEGQKWASIGANALYLTNWEFAAKYSFYFGNDDRDEPVLSDRDNLALSVKYKF